MFADQLLSGLRPSSLVRRTECSLPLSPVDGFQITKSLNFGKHRQAPTRVGALTQGSKKTTRRAIVSVVKMVEYNLIDSEDSNGVHVNGASKTSSTPVAAAAPVAPEVELKKRCLWFEEELEEDLRWVFGVTKILHTGVSEFQEIQLVESGPFGKVLILDGKLQSAEADEYVYHECIIHPALLYHPNPKSVFIMGGGEGSTAREALRHRSVEEVVMCDIDEEVVSFCRKHLTANAEAFRSDRLNLVINCARAELEKRKEQYDVIIGDLADPVAGGPCYQLYTKSFYERILKPRLKDGGILVTQGGPAGILSHTEVYSSIYNTLRQTFKYVVPYAAHVPSYADTWGWVMASDHPIPTMTCAEETESRIKQRVEGELQFLDGQTLSATIALNKHVRKSLAAERHVYTEETARFIHGHGTALKN